MTNLSFTALDISNATEPPYDGALEEHVLFYVDGGEVGIAHVWSDAEPHKEGLTSCEADNGCLDYMIECCLTNSPRDGWYVAEDCTMSYTPGDYWAGLDPDCELYTGLIRPASLYEIAYTEGYLAKRMWFNQLRLHLLHTWGYDL